MALVSWLALFGILMLAGALRGIGAIKVLGAPRPFRAAGKIFSTPPQDGPGPSFPA